MNITSKDDGQVVSIYFNEMLHLTVAVHQIVALQSFFKAGLLNGEATFEGCIMIYLLPGQTICLTYSSKPKWEKVIQLLNEGFFTKQ